MDPFDNGYDSYLDGCDEADNPYSVGSSPYYEWLYGWYAGHNERLGI